jgi:DNA-binding response OmpR family regulator
MPEPPPRVVLVVEADVAVRRMLAAAFRRWGMTAHLVANGADAVEYCRTDGAKIGLVLMEVGLPGMDGPTTLQALRALHPNLRCWFVGGTGGGYTQRQLLDFGAEGLLHKPFDLQALRTLVGPIIGDTP